MARFDTENYRALEGMVAQTDYTYAFSADLSVATSGVLLEIVRDMGLNPMKTADFQSGLNALFDIEYVNLPDLEHSRYILAPNHVSDFDAIILGLLHPRLRIVAKMDWTTNERLKDFLAAHYNLYGLDRMSVQSLHRLVTDAIRYFNDSGENKHFLVFSQGTISDFNHNSPERISPIAQMVSNKTDVPIIPVYVEQVSLEHPTRIVFDEPMTPAPKEDFSSAWLEREKAMQNALVPPARFPKLTNKHANNNKPGDPFFR